MNTGDEKEIRVRFAPSPTGHLHVGGARTALYNWLYARKTGGKFVLRIEDTDALRSTEESYEGILRGLKWLGLYWDEGPDIGGEFGPYLQSARGVFYHSDARKLYENGMAYYCFCTPGELEEKKKEAAIRKLDTKYDRKCRSISPDEAASRIEKGESHVTRFKMPDEGNVIFRDVVRGEFEFSNSDLDDFILIRSDGKPTYNFAVVVDDARMKISHVIRGDDHISNTPRQVHLYKALGYRLPVFAHLPMILGEDKTRLSKRHGATSIDFYSEKHYLPDAMNNYLALLGWSFDGKRELFERKSLVKAFSLKKVSKNPAIFDNSRMEYINSEHFKKMPLVQKAVLAYRALEEEKVLPPAFNVDLTKPVELELVPGTEPLTTGISDEEKVFDKKEFQRLLLIIKVFGNRLKLLKDIPGMLRYFYQDEFSIDENAVGKYLNGEETGKRLALLADELENLKYFDLNAVEETIRSLADRLEIEAGDIIHPCRVALTGQAVSPDIFWVILFLGKKKACERLRKVSGKTR
ncbi:MAG: glutamate--tRNA ligase [Candidatus Krumholzibacteriota bacterium]|nr:glutamate--tRNA ligase [Candidatus Krumholzibacteriota bacterium]